LPAIVGLLQSVRRTDQRRAVTYVSKLPEPKWAFSWKHYLLGDNMIAGTLQVIAAMLLFAIIGGAISWLFDH
jgi:uracil phosphoribosyltransferase